MEAQNKKKVVVKDFSRRIFWDTHPESIDSDAHAEFIIERVMKYGRLSDWGLLKRLYGLDGIAKYAINIRSLDDFSLAFLSNILHIPEHKFRCYIDKQSHPNFWNS